jgi:ABC-2 type transport system permease protein
VPREYGHAMLEGHTLRLAFTTDTGSPAATSVENELLSTLIHLESAVRIASTLEDLAGEPFDYTYRQALTAWQDPPVQVQAQESTAIAAVSSDREGLAHVSPGMMLQFAIAGLLVSALVLVNERKNRCLPRLLTTQVRRGHILLGHYLAIFTQVLLQFTILVAFGQFLLGVAYLHAPLATFLMAASAAACFSALGLMIGVLARSEEQAIAFTIVPMFVLVGLGGGWVPLEVVGPTFQKIGHLSPVAWGMDGFENVAVRGLGVESVLLPAGVLLSFAAAFFLIAAWRFRRL